MVLILCLAKQLLFMIAVQQQMWNCNHHVHLIDRITNYEEDIACVANNGLSSKQWSHTGWHVEVTAVVKFKNRHLWGVGFQFLFCAHLISMNLWVWGFFDVTRNAFLLFSAEENCWKRTSFEMTEKDRGKNYLILECVGLHAKTLDVNTPDPPLA